MKYFKEKMTYFQFIKYLVPSVMTMIFLSFYTTIDGFFVSKYAGSDALAGINIAGLVCGSFVIEYLRNRCYAGHRLRCHHR